MKKADIAAVPGMVLMQVDWPTAEEIKQFRQELGMTQQQFSSTFDIPLDTVRRWEQEQNAPQRSNAVNTQSRKLCRTHRTRRQRQGQQQESDESHSGRVQSNNFITAGAPLCGVPFFDIHQSGTAIVQMLGV
ncbi:DNA-binding transcriptional regulator [Caballeronia sp. TF1N1]|uniref:helix-turn-helix domain-containing protein n=1 Tax=Caballeronia sp. TF1N1 TaxID=2878153 RepID=UPI001FD4BF2E|nr:helix-turn-helix domain-containing protein [Caballeronia sp. TF1N1]